LIAPFGYGPDRSIDNLLPRLFTFLASFWSPPESGRRFCDANDTSLLSERIRGFLIPYLQLSGYQKYFYFAKNIF
jgi:hypothetical protein